MSLKCRDYKSGGCLSRKAFPSLVSRMVITRSASTSSVMILIEKSSQRSVMYHSPQSSGITSVISTSRLLKVSRELIYTVISGALFTILTSPVRRILFTLQFSGLSWACREVANKIKKDIIKRNITCFLIAINK